MSDPSTTLGLPLWMQIVAFVVSVGLALMKLLEFLRKPKLYVHLTRDIFFRLIDNGEALFCSAVLLASNGPILVRNVEPILRRVDKNRKANTAQKSFPLVVSQFGVKVHGPNVTADHKFFGSSPLQYLEPSKPLRSVYLCFQSEYQDRQKRAVSDYVSAIETFRSENTPTPQTENTTMPEKDRTALLTAFNNLIEEQYHRIASLIQLESGSYELEVRVKYECVGWKFFGKQEEAVSTISFGVDQTLLERWKTDLKKLLATRGQQILIEKFEEITYPMLEPVQIIESASR